MNQKNQDTPHFTRTTVLPTIFALLALLSLPGCTQSNHEFESTPHVRKKGVAPLSLGQGHSVFDEFMSHAQEPGPIHFEKFIAADWKVERGGMINLKHERARAAQLKDGPEDIHIYFYILDHPQEGSFMIESGVARSVKEGTDNMPIKWPVTSAMPTGTMVVHLDTKSYLASRSSPLSGVFLTHLHLDHILGLQDIPKDVPLFVGPGETKDRRFTHLFVRPTTKANLKGFGALRQWETHPENNTTLSTVDLFGDQSALGLHIPGHTKGNMAFLLRTTEGPQLITGDGCHTAWGWENNVEPGTFNTNGEEAARSLDALQKIAAAIPGVKIHLGHQEHHSTSLSLVQSPPAPSKQDGALTQR